MDAGIIDQDLDRASFEHSFQRSRCSATVGDIKRNCLGRSARIGNRGHDFFGARYTIIGVHINMVPGCRQNMADCPTDRATATGY